ncbi:MAG: DoxX family membrane protein [Chlamydiae bacterium]|nr:DoxX family membrane protein [Chlamydiota bacterium]
MQSFFYFMGRVCLSSLFIFSALRDLLDWNSQEDLLFNKLTKIVHSSAGHPLVFEIFQFIQSQLGWFFAAFVFMKLLGGVSVLLGWKVKFGGSLLLLFLICETVIMTDFWSPSSVVRAAQFHLVGNNIGLAGGLFFLLAFGGAEKKKTASSESKSSKH